jgi:hypothetical protein
VETKIERIKMTMHDLFGGVDDPITEAALMLAQHDLFVVSGAVMRECLNVLHILAADSEDIDEGAAISTLINRIEATAERAGGVKVCAGETP